MTIIIGSCRALSDDALLSRVRAVVGRERHVTAEVIELIAEVDVRRLYLAQGFSSLYEYCVDALRLTEHEAYGRIQAARVSRRFPLVLKRIGSGEISMTALTLLGPFFTESNYTTLLDEAKHRRKSEIEEMVARLKPKPDVPSLVRRVAEAPRAGAESPPRVVQTAVGLLDAATGESAPTPSVSRRSLEFSRPAAAVIKPLAPERYKVQFTVSGETRAKLRVVQDLLRHSIPTGDIGAVFDRALSALLADLEKKKLALVPRPRTKEVQAKKGSRLIPAAVRHAVWARDKGRCAFVGKDGRCRERGALELHHLKPFAAGGEATVENIELRCRAHNAHEADVYFGPQRGP